MHPHGGKAIKRRRAVKDRIGKRHAAPRRRRRRLIMQGDRVTRAVQQHGDRRADIADPAHQHIRSIAHHRLARYGILAIAKIVRYSKME